ncbi:MAG: hypothetical protein GVY23_01980 [Spirochaetes bacterium]|jgi:tetratricopeptide (TPR) repeat protein|nr:hypothetical protein [Spirochaetota bacterium]
MTISRWFRPFLLILCIAHAAAPAVRGQSTGSADNASVRGPLMTAKATLADGVNHREAGKIQQARATFERIAQADTEYADLAHYYAGLAYRRMMDITDEEKQSLQYADRSIEHLETAVEIDDAFGEAYALLASQYGRKMAIKPMYGMVLGPKAEEAMAEAKEHAPNSPRVVFLQAQSDYFTPEQWGGDKERAVRNLKRSIALFENGSAPDSLQPTWGHDEAYTWLGITQMRTNDHRAAASSFRDALEVNPEFGWVKDVLLPKAVEATNREATEGRDR